MNTNLVSVIIPVYNTAQYLPRCLDSVLNNTHRTLEVICINDGSSDNSLEVLNTYVARDSRVRVIDQENAGLSAARNRGLNEAAGAYIAFIDSDDWIHSRYFELLLLGITQYNADIAVCGSTNVSGFVEEQAIRPDDAVYQPLPIHQIASDDITVWAKLYKTEAIGKTRFRESICLAEDTLFNLDTFNNTGGLTLFRCNCPLYFYWDCRSDSLVHTRPLTELTPLISYYLSEVDHVPNQQLQNAYLIRALRKTFSWRYKAMFRADSQEHAQIGQLLRLAKRKLLKAQGIPIHVKLAYMTMAQFPLVYRSFRIIEDPTMLSCEKRWRQAAREAKLQRQK